MHGIPASFARLTPKGGCKRAQGVMESAADSAKLDPGQGKRGRPGAKSARMEGDLAMKSILLHIEGDSCMEARMQVALDIARTTGAHITCLQAVSYEVFAPGDFYGSALAGLAAPAAVFSGIGSVDRKRAAPVRKRSDHRRRPIRHWRT